MNRAVQVVLISCCLLSSLSVAQGGRTVTGTLPDWAGGEAEIRVLTLDSTPGSFERVLGTGSVEEDGSFTVDLPAEGPRARTRDILNEFLRCRDLTFDPEDARRFTYSMWFIYQDGEATHDLYHESLNVWPETGHAYTLWTFVTGDVAIFAVCSEHHGPHLTDMTYDLDLKQGWNEVTFELLEPPGEGRLTQRASLEPATAEMRWYASPIASIGIGVGPSGVVNEVRHDYPGAQAGIEMGDVIVEVDGEDVRNSTPRTIQELLFGQPGTRVTVGVEREGEDRILRFMMPRESRY